MIEKIKLRHLDMLMKEKVDYSKLMVELNEYDNSKKFGRKKYFIKSFNETYNFIQEFGKIDIKKVFLNPDNKIKNPDSIDDIPFIAMMEIQTYMNRGEDTPIGEQMTEVISMACFSANRKDDFDTEAFAYKRFKERIQGEPALDMIGLFNWIMGSLDESKKNWNQRFFEVEVNDQDYKQAGGDRLSEFNVIRTLKNICIDFNVDDQKAWQVPYAIVQTSSLEKSTAAHIQNEMSKIKEARMEAKRKQY